MRRYPISRLIAVIAGSHGCSGSSSLSATTLHAGLLFMTGARGSRFHRIQPQHSVGILRPARPRPPWSIHMTCMHSHADSDFHTVAKTVSASTLGMWVDPSGTGRCVPRAV